MNNNERAEGVTKNSQLNITDIVSAGESETLEFKSSFNAAVIESLVSFANCRGGSVLVGLDDRGLPVAGFQLGKESVVNWINEIKTKTQPALVPDVETAEVDGHPVVVLAISEYPVKPVSVRGRYYKRVGNSNHQMSLNEIAEMHLHSTGQSMDAVIVDGKTCEDLELDSVRDYMRRSTALGRRSFTDDTDAWQVLNKLELVKSEQEITRAAILLFGKNPQSPLTQAVVHAGRLRGHANIMDNRIMDGRVITQVEETVQFMEKNLHVRFEITGKPQRKEVWDYPLPALREAVTNAICHRDYGDVADIQIKIFEDALQVWSPGGLPCGMTIEALLDPGHSSKPRNKLIAQVFYDLGLIERYGSGIHRILDECRNAGLPEPLFENFSGGFRIKFCLPKKVTEEVAVKVLATDGGVNGGANEGVGEGAKSLFMAISQEPSNRLPFYAGKLEVPVKTAERWLKKLRDNEIVEFRGAPKTGGYYLVDAPEGGGVNGGVSEGVNEGVKHLFMAISQEPGNRLPFYAGKLELPFKTAERRLKTLRDNQTVEFRGAPKTGGYYPTTNEEHTSHV